MIYLNLEKKLIDSGNNIKVIDKATLENTFNVDSIRSDKICVNANFVVDSLNYEFSDQGLTFGATSDSANIYVNDTSLKYFETLSKNDSSIAITPKTKHVDKILTLSNGNRIIWKVKGIAKGWFYGKQIGFLGINAINLIKIKNQAAAAASIAPNGAAPVNVAGIIAMSFGCGMGLTILESYIPIGPVKTTVKAIRFICAIPITVSEQVVNVMLSPIEKLLFKEVLPMNVTAELGFTEGPNITQLMDGKGIQDTAVKSLIKLLEEQLKK